MAPGMRTHMVMDMVTGEIKIQGREGLENKNGIDVIDPMQLLHDCPECRAAMERGEKPEIVSGEALERMFAEALRAELMARPRRTSRKRRWRRKR